MLLYLFIQFLFALLSLALGNAVTIPFRSNYKDSIDIDLSTFDDFLHYFDVEKVAMDESRLTKIVKVDDGTKLTGITISRFVPGEKGDQRHFISEYRSQ